jgi:hypothetical protein
LRRSALSFALVLPVLTTLAGCGGSGAPPAASPSQAAAPSATPATSSSADASIAARTQANRAHARQLIGAAVEWRGANGGACPTLKDVLGRYSFPAGTELDASGAPFTIECTDMDVRIVASGHETADTQAYSAPVTLVRDPLHVPGDDKPAAANVPISNMESVIRSMIFPMAKRCYQRGLEQDPTQSGSAHLEGAPGKCHLHVKVDAVGLSKSVLKCINDGLERVDFCTTEGGGAFQKPVTFTIGGTEVKP